MRPEKDEKIKSIAQETIISKRKIGEQDKANKYRRRKNGGYRK